MKKCMSKARAAMSRRLAAAKNVLKNSRAEGFVDTALFS